MQRLNSEHIEVVPARDPCLHANRQAVAQQRKLHRVIFENMLKAFVLLPKIEITLHR